MRWGWLGKTVSDSNNVSVSSSSSCSSSNVDYGDVKEMKTKSILDNYRLFKAEKLYPFWFKDKGNITTRVG